MIRDIMSETFDIYNKKTDEEKEKIPHINCCEHTLIAAFESFEQQLDPEVFALAKGFAGGMKIKSVCGALTGGVMVLSRFYHDADFLEKAIQDYFQKFEDRYDSIMCLQLKDEFYDEKTRCQKVMINAAQVLDEVIKSIEEGCYE
jgi:C_GCAxxG_C_C family probable redox protein